MDDNTCPYCHERGENPCVTASGHPARQPHAARVQKAHEIAARRFAENDYTPEVQKDENGCLSVRLSNNPVGYDPYAFLVTATSGKDFEVFGFKDWEVFGLNDSVFTVSADFQTVTQHEGSEIPTDLAIQAAKAGARAIWDYCAVNLSALILQGNEYDEENEWDDETVVSHLAEKLGTDYGGALIALAVNDPS